MKAAFMSMEPMKGGVREVPVPKPKDDIVVVKVYTAPMCTEYIRYSQGGPREAANIGHEAAGEVVFVDKATKVKVGDRVVVQPSSGCGKCDRCMEGDFIHCTNPRSYMKLTGSESGGGTMAQYTLASENYLTPIPDGMSYDMASMACCALGPTFTAMDRMNVNSFDTVLVSGLGPVGLGGVINASFRGATVIGVDGNPYRAELAKKLGCSLVVDPMDPDVLKKIQDFTGGRGVDKSVETSGKAPAKKLLLDVLRSRGQAALVGRNGELDAGVIVGKGLTIHGCWHYSLTNAHRVMEVIRKNQEKLEMLMTHSFPLTQIEEAWKLQISGQCGKVLLHPWDEE